LGFAFPKTLRLVSADFDLVMKKGVKTVTPFFVFLHLPNSTDHNRIGLIISKKNIGIAVNRNRYRRIIKESFRLNQAKLSHLDIVVIGRKVSPNPSNVELRACLDQYWQKLADAVTKS
jgi:ribonuclease P protein component